MVSSIWQVAPGPRSRDDTALAVEGIVDSGMHAQEAGGSNAQGLIDKPAGVTAEPAIKDLPSMSEQR